jgi:hypothetical protein
MIIEDFFDLRVAKFEAEEAIPEDILARPNFDIIRVYEPTMNQCSRLLPLGFIYKPSWLLWLRPVYSTVDEYFSSLDRHSRGLIRNTVRRVEAQYQTHIELELHPETFQHWLPVYQKRIAELPHGVDGATADTDWFLSEPEKFVGVFVYDGHQVIAGGISLKVPDCQRLRLIYYAGDSSFRHLDLARYVYFTIANVARELGYQTLSAGADPNFYGHGISTGLYLFKKRMGFQAEPRQTHETSGANVLEKIVSLAKCEDVSFSLGYADSDTNSHQLVGHAFSCQTDVDLSHFSATFLKDIFFHHIAK